MARQLPLFDDADAISRVDPRTWHSTSDRRRSTLHIMAPYTARLNPEMARALIGVYTEPGDTVLDPFAGSGTIPFEAVLAHRTAYAADLNPYAATLTLAKLETPFRRDDALVRVETLAAAVKQRAASTDTSAVPDEIADLYHPQTLKELLAAFSLLYEGEDFFLLGCLLGILHGPRQVDLSHPAGRRDPRLKLERYPREDHPDRYAYRDLGERLAAHIRRLYQRDLLPPDWAERTYRVWEQNAMLLDIPDASLDAVISGPPHQGALDYVHHNRARLWFLGVEDVDALHQQLTSSRKVYMAQMGVVFKELHRMLKPGGHCVLVVTDVEHRDGRTRRVAERLANLAEDATLGGFVLKAIHDDRIGARRRSGRAKGLRYDRIVTLRKKS